MCVKKLVKKLKRRCCRNMENKYAWFEKLEWKNYRAPFVIEKDNMYYKSLKQKYDDLIKDMKSAAVDTKHIVTVELYSKKVIEALDDYYQGDIFGAQAKVNELLLDCMDSDIAVSDVNGSIAFRGLGEEVQFFRARLNDTIVDFPAEQMLHIPFNMRERVKSERFSVPGLSCLYLGNTSYACWIEMGKPAEHQFNVSPIVLDNSQKIFNLAISITDIDELMKNPNEQTETYINDLFKLLVLMIATSYRVEQNDRNFKSEYIIPQLLMLACKANGIDGITYLSKQVSSEAFAMVVAVNLVLFATYKSGEVLSEICTHMQIDDSFNFAMFKHLMPSLKYKEYRLRIDNSPLIKNFGTYKRQFPYKETDFYEFDKYIFANWERKK